MKGKLVEESNEDKRTEKYLEQLYKTYDSSVVTLDKNILYISSGALGISITFLKDFIDFNNIKCLWVLATSWLLLTTTILLSLIMHKLSIKLINHLIVYSYQLTDGEDKKAKKMRANAERLNSFAIWTLISGIILLVLFVLINLYK
ncbi:MAG: hypothetical protein JSU07_06435 [Bacteroidetes bacterium]|nr:hypothetical protein [Bacteroidota bacterium]